MKLSWNGALAQLAELARGLLRSLAAWIAAYREKITFRRVVIVAGIFLLAIAFAQIFTADLAFLFAADMMTYFEIASAVFLIAARTQIRVAFAAAVEILRRKIANRSLLKFRGVGRQRRNANALTRKKDTRSGKTSDDEPAGWGNLVPA